MFELCHHDVRSVTLHIWDIPTPLFDTTAPASMLFLCSTAKHAHIVRHIQVSRSDQDHPIKVAVSITMKTILLDRDRRPSAARRAVCRGALQDSPRCLTLLRPGPPAWPCLTRGRRTKGRANDVSVEQCVGVKMYATAFRVVDVLVSCADCTGLAEDGAVGGHLREQALAHLGRQRRDLRGKRKRSMREDERG
eukprot:176624-Rhodomonas_salina.1